MSEFPRIVVIAPFVPKRLVDNAGQRYLGELARVLPDDAVFIVPKDRRSLRDADDVQDPRVLLVDVIPPSTPRTRAGKAYQFSRARIIPIRARDGFWEGLRTNRAASEAMRRAQVVDLQWPEFVSLAPRVRGLMPHTRLIATMHDVPSQGKARELRAALAGRSPRGAMRLAAAVSQSRLMEYSVAAAADLVVIFSEKDRALLPVKARATVVRPPATLAWDAAQRLPSGTPDANEKPSEPAPGSRSHQVLSLGSLLRPENCDGLEWFGREVLPLVQAEVPDATLIHAGSFDDNQIRRLAGVPVELLGFVPDLEALQGEVGVTIVPLRFGAGVKFKVLDALHDGIPMVSTSVGTEGIGDGNFKPESFDSPAAFADAVIEALNDPVGTNHRARAASQWARERFGWTQFERAVRAAYGLVDAGPRQAGFVRSDDPIASVVIPVRNGEAGLPDALAALARQPEAGRLEIVISDNGSTDRTREVSQSWRSAFHTLSIVDASRRPGVNYARNQGLLAARSELVLFCDHDDEARVGWSAHLVRALEGADVVGGLAASEVLSGAERMLEPELEGNALHRAFGYLPHAVGCSMGVRRGAALAVGGFDESFVGGHDEVEFCWRLQRAGYTLVGVDEAVLDYRQRASAIAAARQRFHSARTQIQLWCRYHDSAELQPVSLRGATRGAALSVLQLPLLWPRHSRYPTARRIGWSLGTFAGHIRYRVLGRVPAPQLLSTSAMDTNRHLEPAPSRQTIRIGMLTPWDVEDERSWSGMVRRMRDELAQHADLVPLSTKDVRAAFVDRALAALLGRVSDKSYLWDFGVATAMKRGKAARQQVIESDVDVVLAVAASTDVAYLDVPGVPVVQVVDTTFTAVSDFYPQFTNVYPLSSLQARHVTGRANTATHRFLASTQWAVDALVAEGVPPEDCILAPPGPAVVPPEGWRRPDRVAGDEVRVLLVASNWERKGGDAAVAAVLLLKNRGIDATLTVVGDAPPLPGWVRSVGRLNRTQMTEEYGAADVLLELASANAAGVTLTDAAAHGLGAVATRVGGVPTIVLDGVTGALVERGPGVEERAAAALAMFADARYRVAVSSASKAHYASDLSWDRWRQSAVQACASALTRGEP